MRSALIITSAVILSGCASKQVQLPKTQFPAKPASSFERPERLSDMEAQECKKTGPEAKNVCRKVEKNAEIAEDQQKFVDRLYETHDGK